MLDSRLFNQKTPLDTFQAKVWRVVESQETTATLGLVDSMQEQGLLETLLDDVKPQYRHGTEHLHYLIKTAFRYPPLKYGSRFGSRTLPSYFYASLHINTALAETAYYRFLFMSHLSVAYTHSLDSEHTVFSVSVRTEQCLNLRDTRFNSIHKQLTHPTDYTATQAIGQWAVEKKAVEIIEFESVRRPTFSNIAIHEPKCIRSKKPLDFQKWLCRTTADTVSFNNRLLNKPLLIQRSV